MPVAPGPRINARSVLLFGFTGLTIALAVGVGAFWLANTSAEVEIRLGDVDFDAGKPGRISTEIADRGPILYSDVAGHDRDIVLSHSGDDPAAGWLAFAARPVGAGRDCFFRWNAEDGLYRLVGAGDSDGVDDGAACGSVTMDPSGSLSSGGVIESYPVSIDGDSIRIDINNPLDGSP